MQYSTTLASGEHASHGVQVYPLPINPTLHRQVLSAPTDAATPPTDVDAPATAAELTTALVSHWEITAQLVSEAAVQTAETYSSTVQTDGALHVPVAASHQTPAVQAHTVLVVVVAGVTVTALLPHGVTAWHTRSRIAVGGDTSYWPCVHSVTGRHDEPALYVVSSIHAHTRSEVVVGAVCSTSLAPQVVSVLQVRSAVVEP